jgi:hypothetical protein
MLLWEMLSLRAAEAKAAAETEGQDAAVVRWSQRLPYDDRCSARTKAGRRCRGRVRRESEFCVFHDPAVSRAQRRANASKGGRSHHKRQVLPDGYLRKLSNSAAVGEAMDRLYRDVRGGVVAPDMGRVLFDVLTRIAEEKGIDAGQDPAATSRRTRAARLRPKLQALLAEAQRAARTTRRPRREQAQPGPAPAPTDPTQLIRFPHGRNGTGAHSVPQAADANGPHPRAVSATS